MDKDGGNVFGVPHNVLVQSVDLVREEKLIKLDSLSSGFGGLNFATKECVNISSFLLSITSFSLYLISQDHWFLSHLIS